jgi:outer membrane protein TolC
VTAYTLEECIQIGLTNQPAVRAAYASLGAAQAQEQALQNLRFAGLISQEIPIRRKQAALGVTIASAGVSTAEWETTYAVTRNYFSVLYARKQEAVLKKVIDNLIENQELAKGAIKVDPLKVNQADIDKLGVYIDLVKVKQVEAQQGLERAKAALREAMGLDPTHPLLLADADLPAPEVVPAREELIALALARRGSMVQAATAAQVVCLEVSAQAANHHMMVNTFAAGADIHATPVPQGTSNGEYRPGAIGIEMPTTMVGHKSDRVRRAQEFHGRAVAVVEKTQQLISLEATDAYLRWEEASKQLQVLGKTPQQSGKLVETARKQFELNPKTAENLINTIVLDAQIGAKYNESLYNHALALAAIERITAGGFVPSYRRVLAPAHP